MTGQVHAIAEPPDGSIEVVAAWYAEHVSALKGIASAKYLDTLPTAGYYTEITTKTPDPVLGWTRVLKQPACRHVKRAVFSSCDGHTEAWSFQDLRGNKSDVFAINSL